MFEHQDSLVEQRQVQEAEERMPHKPLSWRGLCFLPLQAFCTFRPRGGGWQKTDEDRFWG